MPKAKNRDIVYEKGIGFLGISSKPPPHQLEISGSVVSSPVGSYRAEPWP